MFALIRYDAFNRSQHDSRVQVPCGAYKIIGIGFKGDSKIPAYEEVSDVKKVQNLITVIISHLNKNNDDIFSAGIVRLRMERIDAPASQNMDRGTK